MKKLPTGLFSLFWRAWPVSAVLLWGYWLACVPVFLQRAASGDLPTVGINGLAVADVATAGAAAWGVSVANWSWISVLTNGLSCLAFTLVALLIWWRVRTGFGLLTAFILLLGGSAAMNVAIYGAELSTTATTAWELGAFIWPLFFLWLYLFPDGQAVPQQLRWIILPALVAFFAFFAVESAVRYASVDSAASEQITRFGSAAVLTLFVLVVAAQIYRYGKVSGPVEREQTKWFLFGLLVAVVPITILDAFLDLPAEIDTLAFTALPIGIGISMLRYRLWDVDVIIRKTLIYGGLTAVLLGVYFSVVLLAQSTFVALTGQESPLAIVISTLVIAALFNPLRHWLQSFIDRRFYRRKYDAVQTLAEFARTARNEVEMETLTGSLARIVQETLQPQSMTLWLAPAAKTVESPPKVEIVGKPTLVTSSVTFEGR